MGMYKKVDFEFKGTHAGILLKGRQGSSGLVALYNMLTIRYRSTYGVPGPLKEQSVKSIIRKALQFSLDQIESISDAEKKEAYSVLDNIRTKFSVCPRLSGPLDFEISASYMLSRYLRLTLIHGWVVSPEVSIYESIQGFTHDELVEHCASLEGLEDQTENLAVIRGLLDDSTHQLTAYGFNSLFAEVEDDGFALIFCRNRFDVIHKHGGDLFILVTEENIRKQMPQVTWMLFEESQESSIYLTEKCFPVKEQPCIGKAREWYMGKVRKNDTTENTRISSNAGPPSVDESDEANSNSEDKLATRNQRRNQKKKAAKAKKKISQQGGSHDAAQKSSELGETSEYQHDENQEEDKSAGLDATGSSPEEDKGAEAVGSHHGDISGSQEGVEAAASLHQEVDDVPEGVASDFLKFLVDFKDDGCSETYFKGIVEAFRRTHSPRFYVPYEFIMAYNELLALKIQDNYSRISEDLKKSVVHYLTMNGLDFANVELKIIGLPEPKSVQLFLDFVDSIVLHEHYDVYGEGPEALPSSDSRRMGLGYLRCIVAKFRTNRCWGGKWSEANMKVKNKGSEFVIDCEEDYALDPDLAFLDLSKFTTTVFECLRHNGRFPLYFEEFAEDIMGISKYWEDPVKWERFLELISSPLALKPPLVRSSFICNVYLGANANCSGNPPRYGPLFSRKDCHDWRTIVGKHALLKKVYEHQNARKIQKSKYLVDSWSISHWHVFKFSRHFIQHVLRHTKGKDLIQKIQDTSVIDILLSRTIGKSIAQSVRFLVINCGVDGLFSSAWRHYVGSECVDKPHGNIGLEDATATGNMLQGLLDSISDDKMVGYAYSEVGVPSEPPHVSVVISDADLTELQSLLNHNGLECEVTDGGLLQCGSIKLWKRHPKEGTEGYPVLVVEGPYSEQYTDIFVFLGMWLGL